MIWIEKARLASPIEIPIDGNLTTILNHLRHLLKYDTIKILISSLVIAACSLLIALFTSYLLSHLQNIQMAAVFSIILLFTAVILFSYFNDINLKNINIKLLVYILPGIWQHILTLPHSVISRYQSGDLAQRLYDYEAALTQSVTLLLQLMISLTTLLFITLYIFYCSPKLTTIVILLTCFLHTGKLYLLPKNIKIINAGLMQKSQITQFLQEMLMQIDKIRSSNSEDIVHQRWLHQYIALKLTPKNSIQI